MMSKDKGNIGKELILQFKNIENKNKFNLRCSCLVGEAEPMSFEDLIQKTDTAGNIYLGTGGKIIGGDGLLSNLISSNVLLAINDILLCLYI